MSKEKYLINATHLAKTILNNAISIGDIVIDATVGNGHDTEYLANRVGKKGKVYGFDIQELAINNTKDKLEKIGLSKSVNLILDGHENMDLYIKEDISCAVFNLGYLPKGDHSLTTKPKTTVLAIEKALRILKKNGVISITMYTGHEGGIDEKNCVEEYVSSLDQNYFSVLKCDFINQKNNPPQLILIEKKNI